MIYDVPHYINGEKLQIVSTKNYAITNPALGEIIGNVNFADQDVCDLAIKSSKNAWHNWSQTTINKRMQILFSARELIEKNISALAKLITQEHGKTIEDACGSIKRALEVIDSYCSLMYRLRSDFSANIANGVDCYTIRQPLGICFGVTPFNFPIMVPVWMMIPAVACGNTFIIKPSEQNPSALIYLLELLSASGLPDGVINCVHGNKSIVDYFLAHNDIKACAAVASTPIAEYIYKTAANYGKRVHTFGGAKNHCVVMADAHFKQAANAIVGAAYGSAGERCMAISVVVAVGDKVADCLLKELIPLIDAMHIASGDNTKSDVGPVISYNHKKRIISAIDQGIIDGATLLIDGRNFIQTENPNGFFVAPTLFDNVTHAMNLYKEEIFGPVLSIMRVDTLDQALDVINQHQYGNGASIFTQSGYCSRYFSNKVQVGMVGVNIPIPVPIVTHPFGGWKASSFGDINMHGDESINFYTKRKTITSRWLDDISVNNNVFIMPNNE